ncbi:sensor histidine kinase [Agrococcus jejuensis]|uniref:histidine kinase n=1 Tax=Agrococcus jejuensis TaxID=399736 RepID=A0A1G8C3T9_9MICO|nr:sensor histidine kinase [Agrococcus jejuensis]SDH39968.1 Signal transduction histidine kinase [Agrococcus jejuensis]
MPHLRPSRLAIVGAVVSFVLVTSAGIGRVAVLSRMDATWRQVELAHLVPAFAVASIGAGAVASLGLLAIDRWPRAATLVVVVAATATWILVPWPPPLGALPYAFAIVLAVRRGAAMWAVGGIVGSLTVTVVAIAVTGLSRGWIVGTVMTCVALTIVLVISTARRARREQDRVAREQADEQARTRHAREREAMARELHDVLAHSLSSISVQANVALHLADREPARATEALSTIRDTSRQALDDVRHMLGVLRGEADGPLVPEASLDALDAIVASATGMGIRVELDDALHPRPSTATQSAIVRIVREALTNAARHAPGAHVTVSLAREADAVRAAIVDDGPASAGQSSPGAGTGILGMRERAALLGGTLDAAPRGRGFAVVATFPEGLA